jgi:hypothetical protein
MKTKPIPMLTCLAILMAADQGIPASADSGSGFTLDASGTASVYAELSYPETTAGGIGNPSFEPWLESDLRLSAESPAALFRLRLGAYAEGDKSSGIDPRDYSDSLGLEVREAEAALLPSSSTAVRGGILLRNFGVGAYGSPVNPFARAIYQSGFWGLDAEWTPAPDLSTLAILSVDRIARTGSISGLEGLDSGALVRYSPGALDMATGLYASGAGSGELRPIGYVSIPLLSLLASLEAALSVPLSSPDREPWESVRCELKKDMDVGEASLGFGAAYRGIFPGRDETEIASLVAETPPSDLEYLPFAPFYGRDYAELSIYLEKSNAYSLSADASLALPWSSVYLEGKAEVYIGDIGLYVQIQGVAGDANGEFNDIALAEGLPGLELWSGVEISF